MSWLGENIPEWLDKDVLLYMMIAVLLIENCVEMYLSIRQVSNLEMNPCEK